MASNIALSKVAEAAATIFWADGKDTPEEWESAKTLFTGLGFRWSAAKKAIEKELVTLIDEGESNPKKSFQMYEKDETIDFGVIDLGAGLDPFEVLCGLAEIACADGRLQWQEVDIMHRLGESMNIEKEMVSAAMLRAVSNQKVKVKVD